VSLGFVVALDHANPYMSPYQEFQNFKRHPLVQQHIKDGTCLQYGARTLNEGVGLARAGLRGMQHGQGHPGVTVLGVMRRSKALTILYPAPAC
jgi:hypothetical protein